MALMEVSSLAWLPLGEWSVFCIWGDLDPEKCP